MRIAFHSILILFLPLLLQAQPTLKFDFGDGPVAKGYLPVTAETKYDDQTGYGFEPGATVAAVMRSHSALYGDFITSTWPFYFSVKLPDGNYDVTLFLGDDKGTSATTVRVENRRLMLNNVRTNYAQQLAKTFTIHVRDSLIRNTNGEEPGKVRIKSREVSYFHWDNKLTIEFNDSMPKICGLEIVLNTTATTIFLAGNSTVVDQDREPWAAWGQMVPAFLIPHSVVVANYAESGETLKAFERENRLEKIFSLAKPGDYLFIEFTHNDQKPGGNHLDAATDYKDTLKSWITQAKARRIIPVLVTSMHRRNFDSSGHIINTLEGYPEAMRQVAREQQVALIDLNAMSKVLYETWGEQNSVKAFVHYPANTFPGQAKALEDNTHFNPYGAYSLAQCIVSSIREQHLDLEKFIKKDIPAFDPAHPSDPGKFYWPLSSMAATAKPDGN